LALLLCALVLLVVGLHNIVNADRIAAWHKSLPRSLQWLWASWLPQETIASVARLGGATFLMVAAFYAALFTLETAGIIHRP